MQNIDFCCCWGTEPFDPFPTRVYLVSLVPLLQTEFALPAEQQHELHHLLYDLLIKIGVQ